MKKKEKEAGNGSDVERIKRVHGNLGVPRWWYSGRWVSPVNER